MVIPAQYKPVTHTFKIDSAMGGWSLTDHVYSKGQFNSSLGINPDYPISSGVRTSGCLVPVAYEKFSGSNITGYPRWFVTNPKNTNVYVYASDGKFVSYDSSLVSEALIGTPTSGAGNGMAYYNNYIYIATPTDISVYGPMNGSPSLTNNVWTAGFIGPQTALTNTTYPTFRSLAIPNHAMHVHSDNSLYFCDFVNGRGYIHRIHTKKVTVEGDTNDDVIPSLYGATLLPFGFYPVDIESYGTDLAILAIQTTSSTINQGAAMVFLWNTTNTIGFYDAIPLQDPIATALFNQNGQLKAFSGNAVNGVRLSYLSGRSWIEEIYQEEGNPPFAGAVDSVGGALNWGAWTTYPKTSASVFEYGSKSDLIPKALHNVAITTSTGTNPLVTAIKYVQQADNERPRMIIGWGDGSAKGIDKYSTTNTYKSVWRSGLITVGRTFSIREMRISLGAAIASNMSVTPVIYLDDQTTTFSTLIAITSTDFDGNYVRYKNPDLTGCDGNNNFMLELSFAGTVQLPVIFPIEFEIEIRMDES